MSVSPAPFKLGAESGDDGAFHRQASRFRDWIAEGGEYAPKAGRYHLYVSAACPWAHRTIIVRRLERLEDAVSLSFVDPVRDARGWAFTGGEFADPLEGFSFLSEAYERTDPAFDGRYSVPVLWDRATRRIVNNESADIIRMLNGPLGALGDSDLDLYPEELREEIDAINERVYETVNDGVYRAGFARSQAAYDQAFDALFASLDWLDGLLAERRYLAGDRVTEADWRLFTTLLRFDAVYHTHFKCNLRRLIEYPALWAYARELYAWPGVAETVDFDQIKRHYYLTHGELNPSGIVPRGPASDWTAPHGRERPATRA